MATMPMGPGGPMVPMGPGDPMMSIGPGDPMMSMGPGGPMMSMGPSGPMQTMGPVPPSLQALPVTAPGTSAGMVPYEVVAEQVRGRLHTSLERHRDLLRDLDTLTQGGYGSHVKAVFSDTKKANLDEVDWRVPKLMFCKDPRFNEGVDPAFAFEVQQRKAADGEVLERQLAAEALADCERRMATAGRRPPMEERVVKPGVPFVQAVPAYQREDDVWSRKLELRTVGEALRGDVTKPMPRPALFEEDYENYREGRFIKDDCPIT